MFYMSIDPQYVVFSLQDLYQMAFTIRSNLGSIWSVALYVLLTVGTVFVVISIVDKIAH